MSLEATMIIMDNSSHAINGDFYPTRWESQKDGASLISNAKYNANPESMVGVALMAGKQVQVLSAPTDEQTRIMSCLHKVPLHGSIKLTNALSICQLSLKHRLNKSQRQRCVVFICSPIQEEQSVLVQLAKKLKRNDLAVDFINLGHEENIEKLQAFINTINKDDNSHFLQIQPGQLPLTDQLIGSPILGGQSNMNEFGIDPNMDPEIAEAIRLSLQEEKDRQEREKAKEQQPQQVAQNNQMEIEDENLDEEELLNRAKQLSMQDQAQENEAFQDEKFVNDLLSNIPGADPNSEEVKKALEDLNKKKDK